MQDEFFHWKRVGKTYAPSFTAFVIQCVEADANHRLGAGGRRLRRGGLMTGVAMALQRQQAKSAGKLSRRARRIRPRAAVGPTMETSLPRGLVALMDEAQMVLPPAAAAACIPSLLCPTGTGPTEVLGARTHGQCGFQTALALTGTVQSNPMESVMQFTTALRRAIEEELKPGAPRGEVKPACIEIEAQRHHLFPMLRWAVGLEMTPDHEAWDFTMGAYGRHLATCDNQAHLEIEVREKYYTTEPAWDLSLVLIQRKPVPGTRQLEPSGMTAWAMRQAMNSTIGFARQLILTKLAEAGPLANHASIDRDVIVAALSAEGWSQATIDRALASLEAWGQLVGGQNGRTRVHL